MKPLNVELLMGHSSGVSDSYWRPTEKEVLQDYLKAVDLLTINTNNKASTLLQKQVAELTEKSEEQNYIIREKLAKKEKEIEEMKAQMTILHANTSNLFKVFMGQTNDLVVYAWNKDEGPTETARAIEAYKKQLQKEKTQQT
jgi:phage FluMu gp28-like protein